ncbi:PQQ-dependent sugar dehydrogenase [Rhodopirellula sp. JC740]|uniref:PQQ-dependent sugar dehydrogenase n=1 Tax=Rhodopirellula halodulae TaxID=2894198 RepID=A0ABS8NDX9_9BACT|nr:PQQ-dependent sugar dehydrogenase [Rhodopirellula sp. JC740]MCC9641766.1 PQQ-dependent sugar dehydrogenase [Rhodopirellula sp. JC740]
MQKPHDSRSSLRRSLLGGVVTACLTAAPLQAASPEAVTATPKPSAETINLAKPPESLDVSPMPVKTVEAYPNLRISRPVIITGSGDGSGRLFVASQTGEVYVFDENDQDVSEPELFADFSELVTYKDRENEEGFLGMAFHPKFKENGLLYAYFTTSDKPHVSVLAEFSTVKGSNNQKGDPSSMRELMRIEQPFWNHNGGTVAFGPDGYLYVALGDGGKANDPLQSGQDPSQLLGSIMRIDVDKRDNGKAYGIPADNPFVGESDAQPEIYAIGIRNIWRMAFDSKTNLLWAADVGQNDWEEVNLIRKGGNYGWSLREANHKFTLNGNGSDARPDLIDPLVEYPHTDDWGKSVTGGAVYRGTQTPMLDGYYLYGDYVSGKVWALKYDDSTGTVTENRPIEASGLPVFTFGQTDSGEVLVSTMMGGGRIYKFVKK